MSHQNDYSILDYFNIMSWGKLLDLLSFCFFFISLDMFINFSVFSIFSLWIGIVFLQETVDSIPCPTSH